MNTIIYTSRDEQEKIQKRVSNAFTLGMLIGFILAFLIFVVIRKNSPEVCESTDKMCRIQLCKRLVVTNAAAYCEEWNP